MADTQSTYQKMFSYSKRKLQFIDDDIENKSIDKHPNKKKKKKNGLNHSKKTKPKYILHPYKEEKTGDRIVILHPPQSKNHESDRNNSNTRPNRARSAGVHLKSKIKMKKPKKHRYYSKNKHKPALKPSDSDRTNTTTNYKKSHRANQRKKRLFGMDNDQRVISFKANDPPALHLNLNTNISDDNSELSETVSPPLTDNQRLSVHSAHSTHSIQKRKSKLSLNNDEKNESVSFTTDDLSITYKKGNNVLFRPSGRHNEEWRTGVIHNITNIDNIEYLSIMTKIQNKNKNQTFATFYIPLKDTHKVRPCNKKRLSLRPTQSNPSYSNSELMKLGIGGIGVFTDYDIHDIEIDTNKHELLYKDSIICIPNINEKELTQWSSLEVCAWLIYIENGTYNKYIRAILENNVNGKAFNELTFVTLMKLTKYQMSVNDCTNLLSHIKNNLKSQSKSKNNKSKIKSKRSSKRLSLTLSLSNNNNNNSSNNPIHEQLKLGMVQSSDDIDIPSFVNDDNSNQVVIEQGRFWRIFYFPKTKLIQYEIDKPVSKWTPYEVSLWIAEVCDGKFYSYHSYFIQYQIDGELLLNITRKSATNDLKMISPNVRRLFFDELRALSTLKQCNIRQNHNNNNQYHNQQMKQIKRLTHRFTQNDANNIRKLTPKRSKSMDSSEPSQTTDEKDVMVAQKIIKGIHKQTASDVVVADLTLRNSDHKNKDNENRNIHNFVSGEEDDDNKAITVHFQHLTKENMDFYHDTNLHFVEYENDKNKETDPETIHKPAPSVGALFNVTDPNMLSDEPDIEQINQKFDMIEKQPPMVATETPLSIGDVAHIDDIDNIAKTTSLISSQSVTTNLSTNSNGTKIEKMTDISKDSRQSSYTTTNTDTLSPASIKSKMRINLTTHENKTSLLVDASLSMDDNKKRLSDNRNIHSAFEQYTHVNVDVNDEHDDLEIDVWDHHSTQMCHNESFLSTIDDERDPLFAESMSLSPIVKKQTKNRNNLTTSTTLFPFDDIEEKMDKMSENYSDGNQQLYHEPNLTLELNQPISDDMLTEKSYTKNTKIEQNNDIYN